MCCLFWLYKNLYNYFFESFYTFFNIFLIY
jgi:hypothetical protein